MNLQDRIRTRAYFRWLARHDKDVPSELDDWLFAEAEELGLDLVDAVSGMTLPQFSFSQDDIWLGSDQIARLFDLLKPQLKRRRARSHLLSMIEDYQDYLTSSAPVGDDEAYRQGSNVLHILRLITSLKVFVGNNFALTATHTVRKELKDLFGEGRMAFESAEFNVYSAAVIERKVRLPVFFINEGGETAPDLQVDDVAYVECKDIQTKDRNNIEKALADNLAKAHSQLAAAQQRHRLPGTGVCIDVPWGMLPLNQEAWNVVRQALSTSDAPQFLLLSSSGINSTRESVAFPVAVCLVWTESGEPLFQRLLRPLTSVSYRMQPDGFDKISH